MLDADTVRMLYTAVATGGLLIASVGAVQAWRDWRYARRALRSSRRIIAGGHLRRHAVILFVLTLAAGVAPRPADERPWWMLAIVVATVLDAAATTIDRRRIEAALRAGNGGGS